MLAWTDLWPRAVASSRRGWSDQLPPGVSVLVDESCEHAPHWLAVLTGHEPPAQGRVQCAGLDSAYEHAAYVGQVFWHNPRQAWPQMDCTVRQWVQTQVQRWPQWSPADWDAHCAGFALDTHLDKPLRHLSTGSLRKLGMAAAMASGARLTVIEEPIAALDSSSIRYLCKALDTLGEALASEPATPRWVLVSHWEPLPGVTWDEVLEAPELLAHTQLQGAAPQ